MKRYLPPTLFACIILGLIAFAQVSTDNPAIDFGTSARRDGQSLRTAFEAFNSAIRDLVTLRDQTGIIVDTVADLATLDTNNATPASDSPLLRDGDRVTTLGYYAPGDGGGQPLIYHATGRSAVSSLSYFGVGFYFPGGGSDDYYETLDKTTANVLQFGAKGDGVTDDSVSLSNAFATGVDVVFAKKTFVYDGAGAGTILSVAADHQRILGNGAIVNVRGGGTLSAVSKTGVLVADLTWSEIGVDNLTASDSGGVIINNCTDSRIERSEIIGGAVGLQFILCTNSGVVDSRVSQAYQWGIEFEGCSHGFANRVTAENNGLDGFKCLVNGSTYTTDLRITGCTGSNNGARGPGEATNGNGIDCYNAGRRVHITDSVFEANYGAGIYIKNDVGNALYEYQISNTTCRNNLTTAGHGLHVSRNIPAGGGDIRSRVLVSNFQSHDNVGDGLFFDRARNSHVSGFAFTGNRNGIKVLNTYDCTFADGSIIGSRGSGGTDGVGIAVGSSSASTYEEQRVAFTNVVVNGAEDDINTTSDPAGLSTIVTQYGIRVFSDSRAVTLRGCKLHNCSLRPIFIQGHDTTIDDCWFSAHTDRHVGVSGALRVDITNTKFDAITSTNFQAGVIEFIDNSTGRVSGCRFKSATGSAVVNRPAVWVQAGSFVEMFENDLLNYTDKGGVANSTGTILVRQAGPGDPEGTVVATVGSTWDRTDGDGKTYRKTTASGNAGWVSASRKEGADDLFLQNGTFTIDFDDGNYDNKIVSLNGNSTIDLDFTRGGEYKLFVGAENDNSRRDISWDNAVVQALAAGSTLPTYVDNQEGLELSFTYDNGSIRVAPLPNITSAVDGTTLSGTWTPDAGAGINAWNVTGTIPSGVTINEIVSMADGQVVEIVLPPQVNTPSLAWPASRTMGTVDWTKTTRLEVRTIGGTQYVMISISNA